MFRNNFTILLLGISIIFTSNASAEERNVDEIDPKVNEVNTQLLEIDNKLQEVFGDEATISSLGYMIVDKDGVIQISLKNDHKKIARTINSSEEKLAEMISWLEQQEIVISKGVQYSAEELTNLSDLIVKDINNYYNYQFPTDFTLAVEPDVEKQTIKVKYDFSHEAALASDLLNALQSKYNIISFEDTIYTNVTFTKDKKSDWNKSGGGLTVSRTN